MDPSIFIVQFFMNSVRMRHNKVRYSRIESYFHRQKSPMRLCTVKFTAFSTFSKFIHYSLCLKRWYKKVQIGVINPAILHIKQEKFVTNVINWPKFKGPEFSVTCTQEMLKLMSQP